MSSHRIAGRFMLALTAASLALLTLAGPASAHDQLLTSDPADGATVTEPLGAITLEFSAEVLPTGTEVVITGGGADVDSQPAQVDGTTVSVPLPTDLPNGDYDVAWRVVSSDGHPIEGAFRFALAVPAADPAAATPEAETPEDETPVAEAPEDETSVAETPEAATSDDETSVAVVSATQDQDDAETGGRSPLIALIAGIAVVGTAVAIVLRRRNGMRGFGPPGQD